MKYLTPDQYAAYEKIYAKRREAAPVTGRTEETPMELWLEFLSNNLCSLCGQTGVIDTRGIRTPAHVECGGLHYCICPNGRALKARNAPKEKWLNQAKLREAASEPPTPSQKARESFELITKDLRGVAKSQAEAYFDLGWNCATQEIESEPPTQPATTDVFPNDADCKLARQIHKMFCAGIDESCTDETEHIAQKLAEHRLAAAAPTGQWVKDAAKEIRREVDAASLRHRYLSADEIAAIIEKHLRPAG
jgi:hypothetical protein